MNRPLVLASSSVYRAALLRRVVPEFEQLAPGIDESARADESAPDQVERLSREKARAISLLRPEALTIASDQIARSSSGARLGKPGDVASAIGQLRALAGNNVTFLTGVCVRDPSTGFEDYRCVETLVRLRALDSASIENYVARDTPFDCAGSFKAESLGSALFEWIRSDDPTAIVGLPLIATLELLRRCGFDPLANG